MILGKKMVGSQNRGTQYRPQDIIILIVASPKRYPQRGNTNISSKQLTVSCSLYKSGPWVCFFKIVATSQMDLLGPELGVVQGCRGQQLPAEVNMVQQAAPQSLCV